MFSMIGTIEAGAGATAPGRVLILGLTAAEASYLVSEGPMAVAGGKMGMPEFTLVILASGESDGQIRERLAEFVRVHYDVTYVDGDDQEPGDGPAR